MKVIEISELQTFMSEKDKTEALVNKRGELLDLPTLVSAY